MKKRLSDKENNIDEYIQSEATNQISIKLEELKQEKEKYKKLLDKNIHENDQKLESQIVLYKQKRKNWIIISFFSIVISILSLYINFM